MQQNIMSVIAICAIAGLTGPALADCQQELAELRGQAQSGTGGGISKDGSLAPLEDPGEQTDADAQSDSTSDTAAPANGSDADDGEVVKDGSHVPLDADVSSVATSGQDAEEQQKASPTAGDTASDGMSQEAQDALARAEAALEAGDEAGCMEAVDEARSL